MASWTPKRALYWDPPGPPEEMPAKRMCLTHPPAPTPAPRMEIADEIPVKRRRVDYLGAPSTDSTMADEIYPSPCGDMPAQLPSGEASGQAPEGMWQLQQCQQTGYPEPQGNCNPPEGFPRAGTSSEGACAGDVRPPVRLDQPMFTYRQVEQICQNIWNERENWIRAEYDRILSVTLAEQHESFVKFTYEQIQKKLQGSAPSYMS
ncbi:hypothetical protein HPB49_002220 [Dermacentor silvarum]|uniref:Uncharacterized protein n=1 Tax=Dermacentor silvarum TaxID=543639 RepID=A0ACB8DSX2_DERSI|nr:akirin-1B [Dermacentor silvarum]KAH7977542.1 hypothetical protein HPB49_002220 [Dermacentor silvarum]